MLTVQDDGSLTVQLTAATVEHGSLNLARWFGAINLRRRGPAGPAEMAPSLGATNTNSGYAARGERGDPRGWKSGAGPAATIPR
jgi:hypothetical protein